MPSAKFVRCPNALKKATGAIIAVTGIKDVKGTATCSICKKSVRVDTLGRFLDHRLK